MHFALINNNRVEDREISLPVNFRMFNPHDVFSKHDLLQQMVREVFPWCSRPRWFSGFIFQPYSIFLYERQDNPRTRSATRW